MIGVDEMVPLGAAKPQEDSGEAQKTFLQLLEGYRMDRPKSRSYDSSQRMRNSEGWNAALIHRELFELPWINDSESIFRECLAMQMFERERKACEKDAGYVPDMTFAQIADLCDFIVIVRNYWGHAQSFLGKNHTGMVYRIFRTVPVSDKAAAARFKALVERVSALTGN